MPSSSITSSWSAKWARLLSTTINQGPSATIALLYRALRHRLVDQWEYVYFERSLGEAFTPIKTPEGVQIRLALPTDRVAIERDIFPLITQDIENDKRYFSLLGSPEVQCFIALHNGHIVHYTWVFMDANKSPLVSTPFERSRIQAGDVYIGPAFTAETMRGVWIYPAVLATIWEVFSHTSTAKRVLLFVSPHNRGAVPFFQRLGFKRVPQSPSIVHSMLLRLRHRFIL